MIQVNLKTDRPALLTHLDPEFQLGFGEATMTYIIKVKNEEKLKKLKENLEEFARQSDCIELHYRLKDQSFFEHVVSGKFTNPQYELF